MIVTAEGIELRSEDGSAVASFGYFDGDVAPAIHALTEAFGSEPEVSEQEAVTHFPATTTSGWDGFALVDADGSGEFPEQPDFAVNSTVAEVNGVDILAAGEISVGMPGMDVEPVSYRNWVDEGGEAPIHIYLLDQRPVEGDLFPDYEPAAHSVNVWASLPEDVVTRISAPGRNWGS